MVIMVIRMKMMIMGSSGRHVAVMMMMSMRMRSMVAIALMLFGSGANALTFQHWTLGGLFERFKIERCVELHHAMCLYFTSTSYTSYPF